MLKVKTHLPGVLVLGVVSQIGQVLFIRELLMIFQGSEISIGLILAAWLVWVSVGSKLGAFLAERIEKTKHLLSLNATGLALLLPSTILLIRNLRSIFNILPGTYFSLYDMAITCFILMAPTCLMLGMQFVLLSKFWRKSEQTEDTSGGAKTYMGEAMGNIIGGLFFTFLMARHLNAFQSAAIVAMLMPAAIFLINLSGLKKAVYWQGLLLIVIVAGGILLDFSSDLDAWANQAKWQNYAPLHQLIETHQSKHGTISILQREDQYSFYQSGHLVFSSAGPDAPDPGLENQDAVLFAHFTMVQHQSPKSILLIGGGLRGVLNELVQYPVTQIDYIELDEVLTRSALSFLPHATVTALNDPRVNLIHTDGRLYIKSAQQTYDLIIVDIPDPATAVINRFYTREFFEEAKARLNPDGVMAFGAISTPDLSGLAISNRNATLFHTFTDVFPHIAVAGETNLFFFGSLSDGQVSTDPLILESRYLESGVQSDTFTPRFYHTLFQEVQRRRVSWILRHHGRSETAHLEGPGPVPLTIPSEAEQKQIVEALPTVSRGFFINSDFQPIGYFYSAMFLEVLTRAGQTGTLTGLLYIQPWWVVGLLILPPTIALGSKAIKAGLKPEPHTAVLFSVFATGFSAMVLQIALIFSFQSVYGFVYEIIGVIIAIFMLGLACGAFVSQRLINDKKNIRNLAKIQLGMAIFSILVAFGLENARLLISPVLIFSVFSILTLLSGFLNGLGFPLSAACCSARNQPAEKPTSSVYSMELIGACVGASLASIIMAPIWGILICCLIASVANISAFGMIVLTGRLKDA